MLMIFISCPVIGYNRCHFHHPSTTELCDSGSFVWLHRTDHSTRIAVYNDNSNPDKHGPRAVETLRKFQSQWKSLITVDTVVIKDRTWTRNGKEGNVLFNDALNTFYLRLYGVRHMVKDHSDSEKGNPLLPHRLLLSISSKGSFICTIPQTGEYIPRPLLHLWSTGWNEK